MIGMSGNIIIAAGKALWLRHQSRFSYRHLLISNDIPFRYSFIFSNITANIYSLYSPWLTSSKTSMFIDDFCIRKPYVYKTPSLDRILEQVFPVQF